MASKYLFRSQINEMVRVILKSVLNTKLFDFDKDISNQILQIELPFTIKFQNSPFFFNIIHFWGDFQARCLPNVDRKKMGEGSKAYNSWPELLEDMALWLARIKEETMEPDPWLLLNQGGVLTDGIPIDDRGVENFSKAEINKLHEHINRIRQFLITEVKPSKDEIRIINEKLSFLEEAALRQNKRDWSHTAIGVTFTIAIGLAMAPDQAHKLFDLMSEFIKSIFLRLIT